MRYYSSRESLVVTFGQKQAKKLLNFISKTKGKETGGIIIGNYNNDHTTAIISEFTDKPADSVAGFAWFLRGKSGLKDLLISRWKKKKYYLGEWHYHPFNSPDPSIQDIHQMKVISVSKDYKCPEPIMLIIGGSKTQFQIRCFVFIKHEVIELHLE